MRIAFFGSDRFSFESLVAVHRLTPKISVITRKLKPQGRGQRNIMIPPIVEYAKTHGLMWNEVENVEDFENINADLAVAVSYGHLIPSSFLKRVKMGLNVHPSLLPALRGAAPIQRAIMRQLPYTGVSVQTLHPTKFDQGEVLWHSRHEILGPRETTNTLSARLAVMGAAGLSDVIRNIDTVEPLSPVEHSSRAPIIARSEFQLIFTNTASVEDARGRALGKLWFENELPNGKRIRTNVSNFVPVADTMNSGDPLIQLPDDVLGIRCGDGRYIGAKRVTLAGSRHEGANGYLKKASKLGKICT